MTSTVPPATAQWGPAEPALPLGSQARECGWLASGPPPPGLTTHHRKNCSFGLPWPPPRPRSSPCKPNTPLGSHTVSGPRLKVASSLGLRQESIYF